jgi:uncharacterized protein
MAANVLCPICQKQVAPTDPQMPFCSDRCRLLDLGNWASEKYRVPSRTVHDEIDEQPEDIEGQRR